MDVSTLLRDSNELRVKNGRDKIRIGEKFYAVDGWEDEKVEVLEDFFSNKVN